MKESHFRRYYNDLYMPLCMYALRLLEDTDAADDAVQDAFTAAWRLLADSDEPAQFKAYMYRAVRNQALMQMRRSSRMEELTDEDMEVEPEVIDTSERDAAVWNAVKALPEKCRQVFLLSKRDGLTYSEIAEEMGISVKTVENQISKALRTLRKDLEAHGGRIFFLPFLII